MKRSEIDLALEREARLADRRGQFKALGRRGTVLDETSLRELDVVRAELATIRAKISRLLQDGARPSYEAAEVVAFPLVASTSDS